MRVTVIQMTSGSNVEENIEKAASLIEQACDVDYPDLVVLPEMWSCLGGDVATKLSAADTLQGRLYSFLSRTAHEKRIVLHGGSIGERAGEKIYNTSLVFNAAGQEIARYRKIHLFDVVTANGERYQESDVYLPGHEITTFQIEGTTVGCAICYDLRFGYLFDRLRDAGSELILLPAAFTFETGAAHWDVLLRARAVETQCWIAASAITGTFTDEQGKTRTTYGHSMICDAWGNVAAQCAGEPGWATAIMERTQTAQIRERMPIWQHRRLVGTSAD